tara:strand:+ start:5579 stop:6607 length:1029 start_codon:yes stop_codon:yes gene_type:complete
MTRRKAKIANVQRSVEIEGADTVLQAALSSGIDYPHGCKSGRCGSCKSRLIEGSVSLLKHTRFALSDEEKAAGLILACRAVPESDLTVAWLDEDEARAEHPLRRETAEVIDVAAATHDIRVLRLRLPGERLVFSAGQYATLTAPGAPPRDYSMANPPGADHLEFHIRRVPDGATSQVIHGLQVGDRVEIEGPRGAAHLRPLHAGPMLAVAGGSGLAPILSILASAIDLGMRQPIRVYLGAREERDLYGRELLDDLAAQHGDLTVTPVLSNADGQTKRRIGFVHQAVAEDLPDLDGWKCYTAGPPAMIDALTETALGAGLRQEDLHADAFFTPEASADAAAQA